MYEVLQTEGKINEVVRMIDLVEEMEKLEPTGNDEELGELIVSFQNKIADMLEAIPHYQC